MPLLPAFKSAKAASVAQSFTQPLFADLLVVKTQLKASKRAPPVEIEAHLNPIGIGIGLAGLGLALWLTQQRLSPSQETKTMGHFAWPDGTAATYTVVEGEFMAPSRRIPAVTHVESYQVQIPIHKGDETYYRTETRYRTVTDVESYIESAVWVREGEKTVRSFKLKERQGFLGNGLGTTISDLGVSILGGGWWSPWW